MTSNVVMTAPVESDVTHSLCVGLQLLVYTLGQSHVNICVHESSLPPLPTPCQ